MAPRDRAARWPECAWAADSGSPRNPWVSWGGNTGARVFVQYASEERRRPGCRRAAWAFKIRRHFFNSLLVSCQTGS